MDSIPYITRNISLEEIHKVIGLLENIVKATLDTHSLALFFNKSGETTFTSCAWKLLSELNSDFPLTKFVVDAAVNYTSLCGDDCKYFIFILWEMFGIVLNKTNGNDEAFVRRILINEICSLKQILPSIFKSIQDVTRNVHSTDPASVLFSSELCSVVFTFMSSRFSGHVPEMLSSLVCDFMQNVEHDFNSMESILEYTISHFDVICCKALATLSESKVVKGFVLYRKDVSVDLNLQNSKFIILWDLSMKVDGASWKITDESFVLHLNSTSVFEKVLEYFKSLDIMLLLTSSICASSFKILCEKYGIYVIDRLERDEIEYMLMCLKLQPLENLNESLESVNIGRLNFARSLSCYNSHFIHIECVNSVNLFNSHHILLCAPSNAVWKEYYSECLNCFKMIYQWLKSNKMSSCTDDDKLLEIALNASMKNLSIDFEQDCCSLCSSLKINCDNTNSKSLCLHAMKSCQSSLTPGAWEFLFKNFLQLVPHNLKFTCSTALDALYFAIEKCLCSKVGIPFTQASNIERVCVYFFANQKRSDVNFLEPIVCKEIMICSVLDLILQLLKIESVVLPS